jgi:hypothetical protein
VNWLWAGLTAVVTLHYLARLLLTPSASFRERISHGEQVLMGVAMVGMYAPVLTLPLPVSFWRATFGVLALVSVAPPLRGRHGHRLGVLAMLFMLSPQTVVPPTVARLVAVALAALLVLHSARSGEGAWRYARTLGRSVPAPGARAWFLAPLDRLGEAVMALAMATMIYAAA